MILPKPEDVFHKIQMYRLLMAILDDKKLSRCLYFKGGSCASMLGWLDRFSIDLDFDLDPKIDKRIVKNSLLSIFRALDFEIKSQASETPLFVLRYQARPGLRNNLKVGIIENTVSANDYQAYYLSEIDRYAICQTKETMVANKLVSLIDRFEKYQMIAGRDLYDIHYFLSRGFRYKKEVIEERRKTTVKNYLRQLKEFIKAKVTEKTITEDLNYLLSYDKFHIIRKTLKTEVIFLIAEEIKRW